MGSVDSPKKLSDGSKGRASLFERIHAGCRRQRLVIIIIGGKRAALKRARFPFLFHLRRPSDPLRAYLPKHERYSETVVTARAKPEKGEPSNAGRQDRTGKIAEPCPRYRKRLFSGTEEKSSVLKKIRSALSLFYFWY